MAALKVRNLWTAFLSALFALLASVGLTTAATAAQQPAAQTPDRPGLPTVPKQRRRQAVRATASSPHTRGNPIARDRSLPPTIKQRIRAEAHGSSPAGRHLHAPDTDSADGLDLPDRGPRITSDTATDRALASA
ncbi:DUF6344 domain-containing protein [Streptomyces sp. CA-135486]|uniref:DUF6344 domain-containing protein n=1 Tax=Streptomyces sp. CA-135486 TaxID=3240049 RepID=UPI003D8F74AA